MEERREEVLGIPTFWRAEGRGREVVLIHGVGVSSRYWRPALEELASRGPFRVLAPDLPGFGRSADAPWPPELPRLSEHLLAWMDRAVTGPCDLVGQSLGCELAVWCALRDPERFGRLVLCGPTGMPELHSLIRQAGQAALDAPRESLALYRAILPDYFRCGPVRFLRMLWEQKRYDTAGMLVRVPHPTLVLYGERDPVAGRRRSARTAELLPRGRWRRF